MKRRTLLGAAAGVFASTSAVLGQTQQAPLMNHTDELLTYDATALADLVRKGQVTPAELVQATAKRIAALDGEINAITTIDLDMAMQQAAKVDKNAVFAGVPTLLKDLIDKAGMRSTSGSKMFENNVPKESADFVHAMEAAGLNIIGMTNTPELGSIAITDNHLFGASRNPWNLAHTPGGSSGGSAAAVAAGYVPIAHGTDGGGSNRLPASCCGLLGMKPSRYRMVSGEPQHEHYFLRTHQSISRTVRDSAAMFAATENKTATNPWPIVGQITSPGKKRLRIACTTSNMFARKPDASVMAALTATVKLCEDLGHTVVEMANPINGEEFFNHFEGVLVAKMPGLLAMVESATGKPAQDSGLLTPMMLQLGRYAQSFAADAEQQGQKYFARQNQNFDKFYQDVDVWLTPTMNMEPLTVGTLTPDSDFFATKALSSELLSYTCIANALGAPAMSVPLYWSPLSGLPIGSHFMAAPGNDKLLYELAFELEQAQPWANRWAPYSARFIA